jgi:hypothetical protein
MKKNWKNGRIWREKKKKPMTSGLMTKRKNIDLRIAPIPQ